MGSVWAGSYNRSLRLGHTPQPRGWLGGISAPRRAADRAVMLFTNRRRPVELSEWRGVLDALRSLPMVAAGGSLGGLPETPAALIAHSGTPGRSGSATRSDVLAPADRVGGCVPASAGVDRAPSDAASFGRGAASAPPVGCAPALAPRPMHSGRRLA